MKVLIVEDQEMMRRSLRDFMATSFPGMAILEGGNAAQALALCLEHRPRLVLMDISLPDGNGIELTARITALLPGTKVIVVSQHSAHTYVERALAAGAYAYVAKHSVHRELLPTVKSALAAASSSDSESGAIEHKDGSTGAPGPSSASAIAPRVDMTGALHEPHRPDHMATQLRILMVEDVPNDAELALRELRRAGIAIDARRVETAAEYRRELEEFKPQLILADFTMPNFDGMEALAIARDKYPDIPFIFVSGSIGEEDAIRALKQGANDYVMKTNLVRLSSAVVRAVEEQRERAARRDAEYALRASELRKIAIIEAALDCIVTIDAQGCVIEFNPAAEKAFGYARAEVLGKEIAGFIVPPALREAHRRGLNHYLATGEGPIPGKRIEIFAMRKDGSEFPAELTVVPIQLSDHTLFSAYIRDITERKQAEQSLQERAQIAALGADVGAALTHGETLEKMLQLCCDAIVGHLSAAFARIWTLNERDNMLELRASAGMYVHLDGAHGRVPVGKFKIGLIAQERKPHLTNQVLGDSRVSDQEWAKREGMVAFAGYPLLVENHLIGVVAMFARSPLTDVALQGLASISNNIALGIEHKLAEESLRRSQEHLTALIDSVDGIVWEADAETFRFTFVSPQAERLLGYPASCWTDEPTFWSDHIHPDDREHAVGYCVQSTGEKRDHEFEYRMLAADGHAVWLRDTVTVVVQDGRPAKLRGLMVDITAAKSIDAAMRESETRFRRIAEQSPDAMVIHQDGTIVFANDALVRLLRASDAADLVGRPAISLVHPEQRQAVEQRIQRLYTSGTVPLSEQMYVRLDNTAVEVEIASSPFMLEGKPAALVTVRDITERKRTEKALYESEAKYRGLIEQASDGIFITDARGNYQIVNSRACELLGFAESEMIGMHGSMTHMTDDRETYSSRLLSIAEGKVLQYERMMKRKDGSAFPAEISAKKLSDDTLQFIFHDISNRRAQEQRIARLSRIHAVLSGINSAIVRIRSRRELFNEACRIAVEHGGFSIAWIAMMDSVGGTLMPVAQAGLPVDLGAGGDSSKHSAGLTPWGTAEIALREKRPAFDNDIERGLAEMQREFGPDTLRIRGAAIQLGAKSVIVLPLYVEGKTFGVLTLYAPERDFFDAEEIKLLAELAGDISFGLEFIAKEEKVDYLAYYDALTGLPNRSLFVDRLSQQFGTAARDQRSVSLVLMDLDRFRLINDTLGRQAGDALLKAVAQRIRESIRDQDTVARIGADRFAVAISGTWRTTDIGHVLDTRNEALFGQPFLLGQEELRVSATAGVAVFPGDGDDPETLLANAEAALRKAKQQNARVLFYGPEMNARIADSLRLENRMRRALDNGEMVLWYQPKVNVKTRKLIGFEALMRWQDPETGMVPPAKFIPLMEQTGLILEAGRWAMSQVARDCKLWTTSGFKPPRVAVNVSPIQLRQKDFVTTVAEAAKQTREAGSMLDLEITESVIMENVEAVIPKLKTIRGLGVQIAVDDFGTGYSSLAYIARLPIHNLKIDRSFIIGMIQTEDSLAIVKSVISLAHSLRLNVVAEGVETEEQAALLLKLGCDEMQGYLFSRPVPPDKVPELLSARKAVAIRPARRRSRKSPAQ